MNCIHHVVAESDTTEQLSLSLSQYHVLLCQRYIVNLYQNVFYSV